ncbi:MAG: CBS domain-containing protein [Bacteroidia bacterium]|nr:CBS domain-containing protein [Bacteroidia bacterium]MDW8134916.1 CBS domain-containing protein [Bacteroidia bacterium]
MSRATLTLLPLARYRHVFLVPSMRVYEAKRLFSRHPRLSRLPILSPEKKYLASLSRRALIRKSPDIPIQELSWENIKPLPLYATIYDALQQMEHYKSPEIPIVDEEDRYVGTVTTDSLVRWWSHLAAVQERGSVLILETYLRDYSLAEIAQILESDDVRILSAYLLRHDTDLQKTYIVLKVNTIFLTRVIELLERRNYKCIAIYGDLLMEKHAREQLQALLRYLDL